MNTITPEERELLRENTGSPSVLRLLDVLEAAEYQRDAAMETVDNIQGKVAMYAGKYEEERKAREKAEAENAALLEKVRRLEVVRDAADKTTRIPNVQYRGQNGEKLALALLDVCKAIDALSGDENPA